MFVYKITVSHLCFAGPVVVGQSREEAAEGSTAQTDAVLTCPWAN